MNRRTFSKIAGLGAIAVSTTGFVRFNGKSFEGDCQTTTDILGPFYRPDAPERKNLVIPSEKGDLVVLKGTVRYNDCSTPFAGAKVELWHCSADEVYDNDSDEYRYRGTTYCDEYGNYEFTTQMPVPYDAGGGNYRPAHFHMMISAPSYQSLVTQLYFTGDPYLKDDESSASPIAKKRVLKVKKGDNDARSVEFDVNMSDKLLAEPAAIDKLVGVYVNEKGRKYEFFRAQNQLWLKNEVYGMGLDYMGDNTFVYPGSVGGSMKVRFTLMPGGKVKATFMRERGDKKNSQDLIKEV